nr:hypothetical protein [Tanacetum cinerariifolium]
MSDITDVKCVLTQKALDDFCNKFYILEEMRPILPNQNDTMHERPAGKIGLYTRNRYLCFRPYLESYQIALDRAERELEVSVERFFDEGGSGNQTKQVYSAEGEQDANIQPIVEVANTAVENVAPVLSRHHGKRKSTIMDVGGGSHLPKKPRKDHGTPSGTSIGGKSWSALQRLLVGAVLNVEVGVATIPTLPFVTASISTTPEREGGDHTDSMADFNLRTIGATRRFVIFSDSSHHSSTNVAEAEVDSLVRSFVPIMTTVSTITSTVDPTSVAKEKLVEPFLFGACSSSAGETDPVTGFESRPPMLNKDNYVPWSSRLLWYAKSRPNGKLIHNSIINGPYVRRMIPEPGDTNREVPMNETFHVQTDDELTENELKQIEADE